MEQTFIQTSDRPRLLLFFAGWGMDTTPFAHQYPKENDLMICYDYRSLHFDEAFLANYKEIHVIAWSMGVWAASQALQHSRLPIVQSIAINGTPYPVDEERGINPVVFNGTLNGLNDSTLLKFQRRMCGSVSAYEAFAQIAPKRPLDELKEELATIGRLSHQLPVSDFCWNKSVIGNADRIFLPENQIRAWKGVAEITQISAAHYFEHMPDAESLTTENIQFEWQ